MTISPVWILKCIFMSVKHAFVCVCVSLIPIHVASENIYVSHKEQFLQLICVIGKLQQLGL